MMKGSNPLLLAVAMAGLASNIYAGSMGDQEDISPTFNWTGAYLGGHLGGLLQDGSLSLAPFGDSPPDVAINPDLFGSSAIGGILLGYNYQVGQYAIGVEADVGGMNARSVVLSNKSSVAMDNWYASNTLNQYVNGHARVRLGYAPWPLFLFGSGGVAISYASLDVRGYAPLSPLFTGEASKTLYGWTVGFGAEYAMMENFPVRFEYLYDQYGSVTMTPSTDQPGNGWQNRELSLDNNTFRVSIAYKF